MSPPWSPRTRRPRRWSPRRSRRPRSGAIRTRENPIRTERTAVALGHGRSSASGGPKARLAGVLNRPRRWYRWREAVLARTSPDLARRGLMVPSDFRRKDDARQPARRHPRHRHPPRHQSGRTEPSLVDARSAGPEALSTRPRGLAHFRLDPDLDPEDPAEPSSTHRPTPHGARPHRAQPLNS